MREERLEILGNRKTAPGHYILELKSKHIAQTAKPGQFVQVRLSDAGEPLLPRPFSFLDTRKGAFRILYQVVGKGTLLLSTLKKGQNLLVLGPLGKGFGVTRKSQAVLVGGGVGIPPLFHWVSRNRARVKSVRVFLGARNRSLLHCLKDFKKMGVEVDAATDDGSAGHHGLVTERLDEYLERAGSPEQITVYTCGPTPMLKAVTALCGKFGVESEVSVEECMPCGFGACLGCAIRVKDKSGYRYAMSCTEGPVFDGSQIQWEACE